MNTAVRYFTRSGNTKKLADAIANTVGVEAETVQNNLTEKVDILFLGSSVYAAGIDEAVAKFIVNNASKIGKIVNFSTAAIVSSTYKQVKKVADENGVEMSEQEFHCKGSFLMMHRGRPNEEDICNAKLFAEKVISQGD